MQQIKRLLREPNYVVNTARFLSIILPVWVSELTPDVDRSRATIIRIMRRCTDPVTVRVWPWSNTADVLFELCADGRGYD
jgi:hypothetical protein